jgi:hypothetical protein
MRRLIGCLAVGLVALSGVLALRADDQPKGLGLDPTPTCKSYGTVVTFAKDPNEAARLAAKQEKLVMVLHISGIFEDPGLT